MKKTITVRFDSNDLIILTQAADILTDLKLSGVLVGLPTVEDIANLGDPGLYDSEQGFWGQLDNARLTGNIYYDCDGGKN